MKATTVEGIIVSASVLLILSGALMAHLFAEETKPDPRVKSILVKIDPGAASVEGVWPLGFGIPLREGQAKSIKDLSLVDGSGHPVPAAFEMRTRWDDGSPQWV